MTKPNQFSESLQHALHLLRLNRFTDAEEKLLDLANKADNPYKLRATQELYRLNIKLKREKKALHFLEAAGEIHLPDPNYWIELYRLARSLKDTPKIIHALKSFVEQVPDCRPDNLYNLAFYLKANGDFKESLLYYNKALRGGIKNPEEVHTNIGNIYSELRQEIKAENSYRKALLLNSRYIPALLNLAGLLEEQGNKQDAIRFYKNSLSVDSKCYLALCRLANIYPAKDKSDDRIIKISQALQSPIPPRNREDLNFALGKLLDDCKSYQEATTAFNEANSLEKQRISPYIPSHQETIINNIINTFTKNQFLKKSSPNKATPIFICGMFRSGSTLVEQILSSHHSIHAGGELDLIPIKARELGVHKTKLNKRLDSAFFDKLARTYLSELELKFPEHKIVTDKRPDNFLNIGIIKLAFPKAKIIWTKRNFQDNILSIFFQQMREDVNYAVDLNHTKHFYLQHIKLMDYWRSIFPSDIYTIDYENLVIRPELTTKRLLTFLNLPWDSNCLSFYSSKNYVKTASLWQVRNKLYKTSLERAKNYKNILKSLNSTP
ncbi:tetratricopeptide repeat-containing sulfotransferase family protein [Microbulbifer sp. TRSA002]|uniref:tetratricopeptide repeat-containing sulfotransferase family protein n=1 Tax=Microbulbifer sp. TRSA002 TaxID=3243382 RepID=UPI00403921D7